MRVLILVAVLFAACSSKAEVKEAQYCLETITPGEPVYQACSPSLELCKAEEEEAREMESLAAEGLLPGWHTSLQRGCFKL